MDKKIEWYFFAGLCLLIAVLSFLVFQPFLPSLALAIFLALFFRPVYRKLLSWWRGKEKLTALVVVITALVLFITPLTFLTTQLVTEMKGVYAQLQDGQINIVERSVISLEQAIARIVPNFSFNTRDYAQSLLDWTQDHIGAFVFGTVEGVFLTLLVIFLFYYFLYHGEKIKNELIRLSPLPDTYDTQILEAVKHTIDSVLRGTLLIAFIQGVLVGIGLWIFGVPNPVLLGCLAAFTALLPGIGTGVVLIPAILFLFLGGAVPMAIGLAIWGGVVVGLVDNFLVPVFYGRDIKVHPVFVLLSVLGGLNIFGPLGFVFGPIVLSLLFVLYSIYRTATATQSSASEQKA